MAEKDVPPARAVAESRGDEVLVPKAQHLPAHDARHRQPLHRADGGEDEQETRVNGIYHVPKRDLITGLQRMLDTRELGLPAQFPAARDLGKEMGDLGVKVSERGRVSYGAWRAGEHDDLVVATALACWRAKWKERPLWGTRSLGLGYT